MDYRKKIVYQSNYWYNDGLRKAQIRDMSGAIASLRSSLQFNQGKISRREICSDWCIMGSARSESAGGMDHQQEPAPAGQYRELLY